LQIDVLIIGSDNITRQTACLVVITVVFYIQCIYMGKTMGVDGTTGQFLVHPYVCPSEPCV